MTNPSNTITVDTDAESSLPIVELLTGRGFVTGKSGSGKSNSVSVIAEELLRGGYPVAAIDTDGEYWGLKEEFKLLHVGADEECDLQVGPEHAEKLAELALEENIPIVLDVSGFLDEDKARQLIREFARHLFAKEKKLKKPFLLLVEEIHEYIPEGGGLDDTGQMLIKIGKRGRKHGLGIVGISQRPADVKKDFITQCDWLVWHRLTWENDLKTVRRVLDSDAADTVQDLDTGEALLMADWQDSINRVQFRRKETFDAGQTPDLGDFDRPDLKGVSGDLVEELEAISDEERQRRDRIAQLEATIDEREQTITDLRDELQQARDMSEMAEQFSQALLQSGTEDSSTAIEAEIEDIKSEKNARITDLEAENESLREELRDLRTTKTDLVDRVTELEEYEQAVENMAELREAVTRMTDALGIDAGGDEKLRERLQSQQETIEELRGEIDRLETQTDAPTVPTEYEEFVQDPAVKQAIDDAKHQSTSSPRYVKGVVAAIVQEGGPVAYERIADYLGVSTTSDISTAKTALEACGVVYEASQRPLTIDFDMESIADIKSKNRRREQAEGIMENL